MAIYHADHRAQVEYAGQIKLSANPESKPVKKRHSVIEHTLADISHTLEQSLFAEEIARRRGLLQVLDPRVKVLSVVALLIAVGLSRSLTVIIGLYVVALILAWASAVPMGFFVKRVWLFMQIGRAHV